MHERLMARVEELKDIYRNYTTGAGVVSQGENGEKSLFYLFNEGQDKFSNQGGFCWLVTHWKLNGEIVDYGPMDSRELKMMHPELFWSDERIGDAA